MRDKSSRRKKKKVTWKLDDRILVEFDKTLYAGFISELTKSSAKVVFDDGDVLDIDINSLQEVPSSIEDSEFVADGFSQFNVKWDDTVVNFSFEAEKCKFYGWWRKTTIKGGGVAYAIDLHAVINSRDYFIETLGYLHKDPRKNIKSLNADICAAVNKWFYSQCKGTFITVKELQQRADKPTLYITKLNTIDKILVELKDFRDTSLRSGGQRTIILTGDHPDKDPSGGLRIQMNITDQAITLKGKVPPLLFNSSAIDGGAAHKGKRGKGKAERQEAITTANTKTIGELLNRLEKSKDKSEQRKIRGMLRRFGHRGGVRQKKEKKGEKK